MSPYLFSPIPTFSKEKELELLFPLEESERGRTRSSPHWVSKALYILSKVEVSNRYKSIQTDVQSLVPLLLSDKQTCNEAK